MILTCICGATFEPPLRKRGEAKRHCSQRCKTRAWRAANPQRDAEVDARSDERRRRMNRAHPEISKKREAARYASNPEGHRERVRRYRAVESNRLRANEYNRRWRAQNRSRFSQMCRRWEASHPELKAASQARRYARRFGNGGSHTQEQWAAKCAAFNHRCAYCGEARPLTRDHDVPLSRGGRDDIANIIPSCLSCNSTKRTKTAAEFLATMPSTDASKAALRFA